MARRDEASVESHPSFGIASFSRVSGQRHLFASEFTHQHYMTLHISRCERHRDLSRDWYFGREEYIEIAMSEAQFVELITSPNLGQGVPVTVNHLHGKVVEEPPVREEMRLRYDSEMRATASDATASLRDGISKLKEALETGKIGKQVLRETLGMLESAALRMENAIPFVERQFAEHVENTLSHAKVEIEAHVSAMAMRIGVDAMRLEATQSGPKLIGQTVEEAK